MNRLLSFLSFLFAIASVASGRGADRLVFEPPAQIANGKRVVLVSGDEEYRSEESVPMLAKLLSQRFGFHCTALFAIDKETGAINPDQTDNIPGLEALYEADLMILGTRWRLLPGEQLQPILDYLNAGKPLIAFRTATHAFNNSDHFGGYDWQDFGRQVVGENWLNHHGEHMVQGGRGVIVPENADHPVLNGVEDVFTWSDIYGIESLDQDAATMLLRGAVTESLDPDSELVEGPQNDPMMPLAWLRRYPTPDGSGEGTCFATTAGAAVDLEMEDLRRLFVNAAHFLLDLPVPERAEVDPIDPYDPSFYGFQEEGYWERRDLRVEDFRLGHSARSILSEEELEKREAPSGAGRLRLRVGSRIALLGNGLGERMLAYGHFETELYRRFPEHRLSIRNLSRPGDTPGFRPHAARDSQWAYPGAERFRPEFAIHSGEGHFPSPDQWLTQLEADVVVAFFGFNESFDGPEGLEAFRGELAAFVDHSLAQRYNGDSPPQLALVSPIAFEDLSATLDLPDGKTENRNLERYAAAMEEVARDKGVLFVDLFGPTRDWFGEGAPQLTVNGAHLNEEGYRRLAPLLSAELFGKAAIEAEVDERALRERVMDKNWYWNFDYGIPNGVHSYGRRWEPYGKENYPEEIEKARQLTANRDRAIWHLLAGEDFDLAAADAATRPLSPIATNAPERADNAYLYGEEALSRFTVAEGFRIELFASESEFPNLANPAQLSFDGKGRLWVATLPSYPHYRPGDPRPDDKILIYEDTDGDGRADKEIVFADGLHLPIGFELAAEGVYVSQAPRLMLLQDLDGDDRADRSEIVLSGFDTHDTHHAIGAFTADPSGAVVMGEGVFLHSNVETAYGPVRGVNGGFYRFQPQRQQLERLAQTAVPNPWGIAYDRWGQGFYLATSNPGVHWMLPVEVKPRYGELTIEAPSLVEEAHRVRPTSGLEFVSSRHFPESMQGDFLLGNTIGFLGVKQHRLEDAGAGYASQFRQDLFSSSDPNFRPVDLEFAPDGSLFVVDWHNQLIGHMQHSARDPLRDHAHGRIYRISHDSRPLQEPDRVAEASVEGLLELLKDPDYRVRYRARRELRGHSASAVSQALAAWFARLDPAEPDYERYLLEGLWVSWGSNALDDSLLRGLLQAQAFQARAAAVRALRYHFDRFEDAADLLLRAAADPHPRVRLEAVVAASRMDNAAGRAVVEEAGHHALDEWMEEAYRLSLRNLGGKVDPAASEVLEPPEYLNDGDGEMWKRGAEVYRREGHCATCHQADGLGLPAADFPPLAGTTWVTGSPERLIDITLNGMLGPLDIGGRHYPGHVPMTQFRGLLDDEEVAAVLTYVRNAFGNQASAVSPEQVARARAATEGKRGYWTVQELEERYPGE